MALVADLDEQTTLFIIILGRPVHQAVQRRVDVGQRPGERHRTRAVRAIGDGQPVRTAQRQRAEGLHGHFQFAVSGVHILNDNRMFAAKRIRRILVGRHFLRPEHLRRIVDRGNFDGPCHQVAALQRHRRQRHAVIRRELHHAGGFRRILARILVGYGLQRRLVGLGRSHAAQRQYTRSWNENARNAVLIHKIQDVFAFHVATGYRHECFGHNRIVVYIADRQRGRDRHVPIILIVFQRRCLDIAQHRRIIDRIDVDRNEALIPQIAAFTSVTLVLDSDVQTTPIDIIFRWTIQQAVQRRVDGVRCTGEAHG